MLQIMKNQKNNMKIYKTLTKNKIKRLSYRKETNEQETKKNY